MKILPHDFLRAIETHHQRLSPTNQTNKQRKRPHTVSLLLFKNLRSARKTIFFFFCFFSFLQAMGWLLWLCRKFRSHLSRTYFVAAGTTTIRPARRRSWLILIQGSNTTTTIVADSLSYLRLLRALPLLHSVRVRFSAAGIWHSRYHIIDNTAPARHTLLPTVVLPIFSSSIFGANNSHSACLLYRTRSRARTAHLIARSPRSLLLLLAMNRSRWRTNHLAAAPSSLTHCSRARTKERHTGESAKNNQNNNNNSNPAREAPAIITVMMM